MAKAERTASVEWRQRSRATRRERQGRAGVPGPNALHGNVDITVNATLDG